MPCEVRLQMMGPLEFPGGAPPVFSGAASEARGTHLHQTRGRGSCEVEGKQMLTRYHTRYECNAAYRGADHVRGNGIHVLHDCILL